MRYLTVCILLALSALLAGASAPDTLKVLQLNIWNQCSNVDGAVESIIDVLDQTGPDIAFLCEMSGPDRNFMEHITSGLRKRGKHYFGIHPGHSTGILSRYALGDAGSAFSIEGGSCPATKATVTVRGKKITLYSVHWDYTHYECYMPRGYSGTTWKKLQAPVSDSDSILKANRLSLRDEGVAAFINDAAGEIARGNIVIMGGDFNEPSHLDWQSDTKDLRDHNGLAIDWDCSVMLQNAGFRDAYRELYPDPVTHPAMTWPAGNRAADMKRLVWIPDRDDRDRIDFIYYRPDPSLTLHDMIIVGPREDVSTGEIISPETSDRFLTPSCIWPSDHKGNLATFILK